MKDYVIITDSCCDLPSQYIIEKNIPLVSLTCSFQGKDYLDDLGQSLSYKEFYDGMRKGEIPKTSQPSPEAFYRAFKEIISKDKEILYIAVSSGLSGTYNSANIAKDMVLDEFENAKIEIVDVLTASLGQGVMVINAVNMKEKGAALGEIKDYLENNRMNLNTFITVDDLNHLRRGGRISSAAAFVGAVLHIKPVITLNDEGKVIPVVKIKGRKNVINKLAEYVIERIENSEDQTLAICHGDSLTEAERLRDIILKGIKVKDVVINNVGPVVGTYGGPGALAVFFIGKHRQNHVVEI